VNVFRQLALGAVLALFGSAAIAQEEVGPAIADIPEPPKWERSLDFGIVGSTGNTVERDINLAFEAHKATDTNTNDITASYRLSSTDNKETDNRLYGTGRRTWLFTDSKWGIFTQGSADIDRFKAWDQRITGHAGLSYRIFQNDKTFFEARAGGIWTSGTDFDTETDPEGVLGVSLRHQFNEKWSLKAGAQYFPNLKETNQYRYQYDVSLDYALSETWSFRAGIEDIFDSSPDPGDEADDFYYTFKLAWKF
jgi:putative salt-induced outer membrane protein YdiY